MAIFRVEKTRDYTIMSNHHLKNRALSLKAKGLLSLMLSLPDGWDYTMKGLAAISVEGVDSIRQALGELEQHCYVVRARERDEKGYLRGSEYVIYEQPQAQMEEQPKSGNPILDKPTLGKPALENPILGNPILENPILDYPTLDNPALDNPTLENPTQLNTKGSNTYPTKIKTGANPYPSNPHPSYPGTYTEGTAVRDRIGIGTDMMGCPAAACREAVHRQISYDVLEQDTQISQGRLDEIVDLMVEVLCATNATMTIAGNDIPTALVQERFQRINSQHILYIFHCLDKTTSRVRNIKKYLLAALFNAPSTMGGYYASLVNQQYGIIDMDDYDF